MPSGGVTRSSWSTRRADACSGSAHRIGPPIRRARPTASSTTKIRRPVLRRLGLVPRLIAADLVPLGISVDCLPLADVPVPGADAVIRRPCLWRDAGQVAALGDRHCRRPAGGRRAAGAQGTSPATARATADSHERLPVVTADRATLGGDRFRSVPAARRPPLGMDGACRIQRHRPGAAVRQLQPQWSAMLIRGFIGFDGLLMSDDVSMGAWPAPLPSARAPASSPAAIIVLHCNGKLDEMQAVAAEVPELSGTAARRAEAALARPPSAHQIDLATARRSFDALMAIRAGV